MYKSIPLVSAFILLAAALQAGTAWQPADTTRRPGKVRTGDTLVYYQVLYLRDQHRKELWMAVFAEAVAGQPPARTRMKADYLLQRERRYLSKIFFTRVEVVEEGKIRIPLPHHMKGLQDKYPGISLWTVLHVNAYYQ